MLPANGHIATSARRLREQATRVGSSNGRYARRGPASPNPMRSVTCLALLAVALAAAIAPLSSRAAGTGGTLTKDIEYANVDGESLRLDAYVPDGPGPFPTVILVHGGGWNTGDKSGGRNKGLTTPMDEPLSRGGFTWFEINYRLAPKHPYPAGIEDVETAIRWVKAHVTDYRVDPTRIALLGESAGGNLVDLAATRADESTRVAAVVSFYGPYDLVEDAKHRGGLTTNLGQLFGHSQLDDQTTPIVWDASPAAHIHPGLPPFLLLHGDGDKTVPYQWSVEFRDKLLAAGVHCQLITIPDGIHGMLYWDKVAPGYQEWVVAWLKRTLKSG